jgi:hypothetical protein
MILMASHPTNPSFPLADKQPSSEIFVPIVGASQIHGPIIWIASHPELASLMTATLMTVFAQRRAKNPELLKRRKCSSHEYLR